MDILSLHNAHLRKISSKHDVNIFIYSEHAKLEAAIIERAKIFLEETFILKKVHAEAKEVGIFFIAG